ncbi:phage tail protein [Mycobacterium sp. 050134]|uniref:phage tail protein n=1 Tax=Mycobacterium sp. 050134 TaxID=3096111 RepID=UPI002ED945DF
MTDAVQDGYEARYADKLWSLVPAVYRAADATTLDRDGPLRELLDRIGASMAVIRRSIDRLWEDQSIETCDSWVIPYVAQLLATNLVPAMDQRAQRLDVANTISYRRRKGTVAMLEQLAHDVTGYETRVIEFFRRLARHRHNLDPPIGRPASAPEPVTALTLQRLEQLTGLLTGTPAGGWADLRVPLGAELTGSAFDEYAHRVDVRYGRGNLGWYGIPKVGFFLWRSVPIAVTRGTPVPVSGCDGYFAFDPTGRQIPLFTAASRGGGDRAYGDNWLPVLLWQVPMPLTDALWQAITAPDGPTQYPDPGATALWGTSLWATAPGSDQVVPVDRVQVWPEVGRLHLLPDAPAEVEVGYHYGLFSLIGAGPYDRRQPGLPPPVAPPPITAIPGGSAKGLADALGALGDSGTVEITDGRTLTTISNPPAAIRNVVIRAADEQRAVIRTDPGTQWIFTGTNGTLRLEALLVSGADVVLRGTFSDVTLSCCTLDPGSGASLLTSAQPWDISVDGRPLSPVTVWVEGTVQSLIVERCITGPIRTRTGGVIETLAIADSVVQGLPVEQPGQLTQLRDADAVFSALAHQRDALSTWLAGQLVQVDQAAAEMISAHTDHTSVSDAAAQAVVAALQNIIDGPLIYTDARFADRSLRESTRQAARAAVASSPTSPALRALNRQLLAEAYPLALADAAIATDAGLVELTRCSVLGQAYLHRLHCSETILDDVARVQNAQDGCVRFSAWCTDSALPRPYESVQIAPDAPIMVSRRFGEWGYAQLDDGADAAILDANTAGPPSLLTGSHDGSQMGVFCRDNAALKDRSLLIKLQEFLPVGLSPVLIHLPGADPDGELMRGRPWPQT